MTLLSQLRQAGFCEPQQIRLSRNARTRNPAVAVADIRARKAGRSHSAVL